MDAGERRPVHRTRVGGDLWRGDWRRNLRSNLAASSGPVVMVTFTGPGDDVLPRGPRGRVYAPFAREANAKLHELVPEVHRQAQQAVRREGLPLKLLAYCWQEQGRGIDHGHYVLPYGSELEKLAFKRYRVHVKRLARRHGLGHVDARDRGRGSTVMEAARAARYLSRYFGSAQLESLLARPRAHQPRRIFYVGAHLSRRSGCTMRRLRRVRYLHMIRTNGPLFVFGMAGRHPRWFGEHDEYERVCALYQAPRGP